MTAAPLEHFDFTAKPRGYDALLAALAGLLSGESDAIANAANTAALLFHALPDINWVGFYFLRGEELVLGPFQGKPACVRIRLGRGVCGTAAASRTTVRVSDVEAFPGHIACDAASRSEIVVPLTRGAALIGVLDVDSPKLARFDAQDQEGLMRVAALYLSASQPLA